MGQWRLTTRALGRHATLPTHAVCVCVCVRVNSVINTTTHYGGHYVSLWWRVLHLANHSPHNHAHSRRARAQESFPNIFSTGFAAAAAAAVHRAHQIDSVLLRDSRALHAQQLQHESRLQPARRVCVLRSSSCDSHFERSSKLSGVRNTRSQSG